MSCPLPRCLGIKWVEEGSDIGQGACVGRLGGDEDFKVHCYALPSSTLTAWGLMAPVRAGLTCPVESRGSWSLLVMPTDDVLPSPTALRMSRMVLFYIYSGWLTFMPSSGPLTEGSGAEGGVEWGGSRPGEG